MLKNPQLSIIIPAYNERNVLPICYTKVSHVMEQLEKTYEIIFIDDGSKDGSADYLAGLAEQNNPVKVICLSRNFGKEAALTAGIEYASGDAVVILDADLQDPPELIPDMLKTWQEKNVDVVLMRRRSRAGETATKRLTAFLYYRLLNKLSDFDISEDIGDFRLMSRHAVDALKQLPERNRYMKGLFSWIGMDTAVIEYDREPRVAGGIQSNYVSLFRLAIQGITSFSVAPLRLAMIIGVIVAGFGTIFGLWIIFKALLFGDPVQGYPSTMAIITFLGGTQLFTIGILGEYVGKIYIESKQRPNYLIKKIIDK